MGSLNPNNRRMQRKYERQRTENALLRNVYSSLVLGSKLDWARKSRVRELMLYNEEEPGVPEDELSCCVCLNNDRIPGLNAT